MDNARVILVGIGGATCSGKTTLAKQLLHVLPNSVIVHQDDFCVPIELIPIHPVYNVQDWDNAASTINWPRFISFLKSVNQTGLIPPDYKIPDRPHEMTEFPLSPEVIHRWRKEFGGLLNERGKVFFVLVDGFLLYWHKEVLDQLDLRVFLRVPRGVLEERRHRRNGYFTAEGSWWQDPPGYWQNIAYPAYEAANKLFFESGDIEQAPLSETGKAKGLILIEGLEVDLGEILGRICEGVIRLLQKEPTQA